jgi:TolA-binding protein
VRYYLEVLSHKILAQYHIKIQKHLKRHKKFNQWILQQPVVTETFQAEEKILPQDISPKKQYEFATSFLKVGDYSTAERAFREFVLSNSEHELAGSAQYWYA